jgi:phosphoribosylformylglycinamidine synthase
MGGSILAQTFNCLGDIPPDVDEAPLLKRFFESIKKLNEDNIILAYHDRSDGGLFTTLIEMAFAGNTGIDITLDTSINEHLEILFNEELGAIIQVSDEKVFFTKDYFSNINLPVTTIGKLNEMKQIKISRKNEIIYKENLTKIKRDWSETSFQIQARRGNAYCAQQEFDAILSNNPGLQTKINFDINQNITFPFINHNIKPRVAILRDQGVNGQIEMAAAFDKAEFDSVDVHMSDLINNRQRLSSFNGLIVCGGFSYGDVLGAGEGWAKSILFNTKLKDTFQDFFHKENTFSLGVCNGCQMLANLKALIPGADHWPKFVRNESEEFEARFSLVKIEESPSILLSGMAGSIIPVAVSHGEGKVEFENKNQLNRINSSGNITLRFVDNSMTVTERYPFNPNGSVFGVTGITSSDGRTNIMMPHPERVFRSITNSWCPEEWGEDGPWLRMFQNARIFVN